MFTVKEDFNIAAIGNDPSLFNKFFQGTNDRKYKIRFPDRDYTVKITFYDGKPFNLTEQKEFSGVLIVTTSTSDNLIDHYLEQGSTSKRKSNRRRIVESLLPNDSLEDKLYSIVGYLTLEIWERSKQQMWLIVS